ILISFRAQVPAKDTHLLHTARMALRDHLKLDAAWRAVRDSKAQESQIVADACLGLPDPAAAQFLLDHVRRHGDSAAALPRYAYHIARHGTAPTAPAILEAVRYRHEKALLLQAAVLKEVFKGIQERGGTPGMTERHLAAPPTP